MKLKPFSWNLLTRSNQRNFFLWFFFGLICSLLIHFFIFKKLGDTQISSFNPASFDVVLPRKFHLERVEIDPKLLEEPKKKEIVIALKTEQIFLKEKETIKEENNLHEYGSKPDIINTKELSEEKPEALIRKNIISETFQQPNQPQLLFDTIEKESDSFLEDHSHKQESGEGHYSQLDQLIEQKIPLTSQTAPILLPTDLLFEYNADQLKPEAEKSLGKLALLIQRNPKAQFIIEGFTDSFGSDDYNLDLSSRRANSIKKWLITKQFINFQQIQAYGVGKKHFIVPSTGTIEQQRLNRRVEIVIQKNAP